MNVFETHTGPDGRTLHVSHEATKGQKGPFLTVYADGEGDERWGYYCTNCETFDNAMDTMGRIQCNECANVTKAEEWDAAHE